MTGEMVQKKCLRILVEGRVQGVWYRGWCRENALELGLDGWVRNRRGGNVEAVLKGEAGAVEEMIALCWQGPGYAEVVNIIISDEVDEHHHGFEIRATL